MTAVTSQVARTTGASNVGASAASVPSMAAPSRLGPRFRPAVSPNFEFPKGVERDVDVGEGEERAQKANPPRPRFDYRGVSAIWYFAEVIHFAGRPNFGLLASSVSRGKIIGWQFFQWTTSVLGCPLVNSPTFIWRHDLPSLWRILKGPLFVGESGLVLPNFT